MEEEKLKANNYIEEPSKLKYSPVTHCIFEIDGILLDTVNLQRKRLNHIFYTKRGIKIKPQTWYTLQGHTDEDQINIIYEEYYDYGDRILKNISPVTLLNEYRSGTNLDYLLCDIMPGAQRLVHHLKEHEIPMAIASSTSQQSYSKKIVKHYRFFDCNFHHATLWGVNTQCGKPSSDLHLQCVQEFEEIPPLDSCLAFESSMAGIAAAITSDMQVVMVPTPFMIGSKLMKYPTLAIKHLDDFVPEEFGLPPFCECPRNKPH